MTEAVVDGGAPAPADGVIIEQAPVNIGEPLPPQAEAQPKEPAIETEKVSSRDAVRIAREQLKQREAEKAKPQEAKPEGEAQKVEAKKTAAKQVEAKEPKAERERGPDGKFYSSKKEHAEAVKAEGAKEIAPQEQNDKWREPPRRVDAAAKAKWAETPDEVKGAFHRAIDEMENGIRKYKEAADEYETIRYFGEWAKSSGTSLKDALTAYTNMEQLLRNPQTRGQGLAALAQNMGTDPMTLAQELVNAAQGGNYQQAPQQPHFDPRQIKYELREELKQELMQQSAVEKIEQFKREHPRFEELSEDIAMLLSSGKIPEYLPPEQKLLEAYELAERLNPAPDDDSRAPLKPSRPTEQVLIQTQEQRRQPANLSISGAPNGGSNPADQPRQAKSSIEAVRLARKRLGG